MNLQSGQTLAINGVTADFGSETLRDKSGKFVDLRPQAFAVLRYLTENADRLVTKDELMQAVWPGIAVTDDSLVQCIRAIRLALHDDDHSVLKTVPKRGYQLVLHANAVSGSSAPVAPGKFIHLARRPALITGLAAIVLALATAGAGVWFSRQDEPALSAKPSIAVLTFDNIGGDETTGRLARGISEDIITDIARDRDVDVISRNSTALYEGKPVDVRQVGRDLNVRYVLEGSVQRQGERIRITAQLVDARTAGHLWSERWDRPIADFFAVQTEIAERVVNQFAMTTGPVKATELGAARRKRPQNLTAYELELFGGEKLSSPTRENVAEATDLFKKAVAADPNYARAWSSLAWAHQLAVNFGADRESSNRLALEAAERAIALDPNDAEAYGALGEILGSRGEFGRSKVAFGKALALNPGSFSILVYYASWASSLGEPVRGAEMADRAIRINPNYQPWACGGFRYAYFMVGRYADALRVMERQTPDNYSKYAWVERAGSLAALGRIAEAQATVKEASKRYPNLTIETVANDPGYNEVERQRHVETMRLAGFPTCAPPEEIAKLAKPFRLSECAEKR